MAKTQRDKLLDRQTATVETRGKLICGWLNLNSRPVVEQIIDVLTRAAATSENWHPLEVVNSCHFACPGAEYLPTVAGWYIICDGDRQPLYVGQAENLNRRLNSENGTRDNFANRKRARDPVRNFVKAFPSSGSITSLTVLVMREDWLCAEISLNSPLASLDRDNVEKLISVFRGRILRDAGGRA